MFAVIRIKKLKGAAIFAMEKHNSRSEELQPDGSVKKWAANADPTLKHLNQTYERYKNTSLNLAANKRIEEAGIIKIRKDAVKVIEILCTTSPEFFIGNERNDKIKRFCKIAYDFIKNRYGKENVIKLDLHLDEKTPHIHFMVSPITKDNRLCAKEICGNRKEYQKLQSDYAAAMKPLGLSRGVEGSIAKHIEMKEFYGATKADVKPINDLMQMRRHIELIRITNELKKQKVIISNAYSLLNRANFKLDPTSLKPVKISNEKIEPLQNKQTRNEPKI